MSKVKYEILQRAHTAGGQMNYFLEVFGDEIAKREGYKEARGMDAVHFYLIHKHHWLPRDVRSMSAADLQFLLLEELSGWTAPTEALPAADK